MADLSAGRASVPHRVGALVPEREGLLAAMPGYTPSAGALASKLVTLFPGNAGTALPTHQAVIAVFDPDTGRPAALLDGTAITAIRTGAGTHYLFRSPPGFSRAHATMFFEPLMNSPASRTSTGT
jgi:alanine dehydrogenase